MAGRSPGEVGRGGAGLEQIALRPAARQHHAHVALDEGRQVHGPGLRGDVRVHVVGELAKLLEGGQHFLALQRIGIELHDRAAIDLGTDSGERNLEFLAIVRAVAAIGQRDHAGGLHLFRRIVELGPGGRRLADLGPLHALGRKKQRVEPIDLQGQRDPMASRLAGLGQFRRDLVGIARGLHQRADIDGRRDLRPGGNLGPLELRNRGRIPGHDLRPQLVHHIRSEARHGIMLPDSATVLEQFAERRDRRAIAAGGPLRDGGDARLGALGEGKPRHCKCCCGSSEQTTPCYFDRHDMFLPGVNF